LATVDLQEAQRTSLAFNRRPHSRQNAQATPTRISIMWITQVKIEA
jgi:hypothetical protein